MAVGRLAAALGKGALRRAIPAVGPNAVVPQPVRMGRAALPGEARAAAVQPIVPPGAQALPTWFGGSVRTGSPVGFGTGPSRARAGLPRTAEDLAAAREEFMRRAAGAPSRSVSLGSTPRALEGQVLREEAVASGILKAPTRREVADLFSDVEKGGLSSLELSFILPSLAPNQVAFGNAIKRVRFLKMDPKITDAQRDIIDDNILAIARERFGISATDDFLSITVGEATEKVSGPALKVAQQTAKGWLDNATTSEDMTEIYNFVLQQGLLDSPSFRNSFLIAFENQMSRVGRGAIRRIIGEGTPLDDDVALAVWQQITGGGLRSGELLRSINKPKVNDYAAALRTSYTKRELDEVGSIINEAVPVMKQADVDMLFGLYSKQQDLVFKNAFNRIQNWLKQEQGEQMTLMSSEIRRLKELPPGPKIDMPQPMRSRAKGVRKATDPSSSIVSGPTGGSSWRGGEGEMGISQIKSQALDTSDMHRSYITRAYMNRKARESSSIFTTTVKRGDDRIGQGISNVTYADAGLRQPYIVGKPHDKITVRMVGRTQLPGQSRRANETAEEFALRVGDIKNVKVPSTVNVSKLSADTKVDRVFERDLIDDLTLMTRPDSDFLVKNADGTATVLARAPLTKASEGLPNNLTAEQAKDYIKSLDISELQRLEMQHWVDRYGYRMLYDVRYARSITELDQIAERMAAAFASGRAPKGFYEVLRQTMSQKASMLPTGSRFMGTTQKKATRTRRKRYNPPQFRFTGATSFEDFMRFLASDVPAGRAARSQGVSGIQFPQ